MPSFKVGGGVEGAASTMLEHVQRQTKRKEEEEDAKRTWHRKVQELVLSDPGKYNPRFIEALLSGKDTTGIDPSRGDAWIAQQKLEQSPFYQERKAKRTEELISTIERGKEQRRTLHEAEAASTRIPTGLFGKLAIMWNKAFNPNSPSLEDWQKIKLVLTDAQLLNVGRTKGAISDREMELFSQAAANDDISSIRRMRPVFNRLLNALNADEQSQMKTYQLVYGEDPSQFVGDDSYFDRSFASEREAEAANLPSGTRITINGRPAIIE